MKELRIGQIVYLNTVRWWPYCYRGPCEVVTEIPDEEGFIQLKFLSEKGLILDVPISYIARQYHPYPRSMVEDKYSNCP